MEDASILKLACDQIEAQHNGIDHATKEFVEASPKDILEVEYRR